MGIKNVFEFYNLKKWQLIVDCIDMAKLLTRRGTMWWKPDSNPILHVKNKGVLLKLYLNATI